MRRFERAQSLRDLVRRLKLSSRIENACFEGGVARTCDTRALWNGAFLLAGEFLRSAVERAIPNSYFQIALVREKERGFVVWMWVCEYVFKTDPHTPLRSQVRYLHKEPEDF